MISSFLDLFNRSDRGPTTSVSLIKNIHRYEIVEKGCKEGIVDFYNGVVEEKETENLLRRDRPPRTRGTRQLLTQGRGHCPRPQ